MMERSYLVEKLYSRVSFAVRLTDDYTSGRPAGCPKVYLQDRDVRVVKNLSGYYVFSDLAPGIYTLGVKSEYYLDEEAEVNTGDLDPKSPVVNISIRPGNAYPFPAGATLVRAVVLDSSGQPARGAGITAEIMQPESAVKARVGPGEADVGSTSIRLNHVSGSLNVGDSIMIKDSSPSRNEFCQIAPPLPANPSQAFNLFAPLKFDHNTGTPLYLMIHDNTVSTRTGERGEFAVYFKSVKSDRFPVRIEVIHPGHRVYRQEVEVFEGRLTSMGIIQLSLS
ncbi:MAG: hypothetical protein CVU89_06570 [Firmicutes bacterium HGW-Firmicutes-14]|jgi:hypothetical protein|nr:MAG: hypothetical protein CVU89_06570 [Firmicutes bacterium HGW-Firmicutes-14]